MTDPIESSTEDHSTADHASSASTAPSGGGLALALVVLGVFLMTLITGLALWLLAYNVTGLPSASLLPASMIMIRIHGHFAAAMILVLPMAIIRAVFLWKEASKYAVSIVEVAAFVALAIALWDPTSLLPWRHLADGVLSLMDALWNTPDTPPVLSEPYNAREIMTAGRLIGKAVRMRFWFFHAVIAPLALIGVGAVFINRRRSAINKRHDPTS